MALDVPVLRIFDLQTQQAAGQATVHLRICLGAEFVSDAMRDPKAFLSSLAPSTFPVLDKAAPADGFPSWRDGLCSKQEAGLGGQSQQQPEGVT